MEMCSQEVKLRYDRDDRKRARWEKPAEFTLGAVNFYQLLDWVVTPATARYSCSLVGTLTVLPQAPMHFVVRPGLSIRNISNGVLKNLTLPNFERLVLSCIEADFYK